MTEVAILEGRLLAWVPGRLTNPLNGAHRHWAVKAKERKGWRERTYLCVTDAARKSGRRLLAETDSVRGNRESDWWAGDKKVVVLTAYVWNLYDEDGLAAALKPVVDGLRDAHVIHSDDTKSGHRFERRQVINRKHRGVEVVVERRAWLERPTPTPGA